MRVAGKESMPRVRRVGQVILSVAIAVAPAGIVATPAAWGQAAPAANPAPQRGTVKSIDGNVLTVATDAGSTVKITVPDGAKVEQLAPGSTDLKTASPSQVSDIAVGDRVLASVRAGSSPDAFDARTVVLMKSGAIAQKNAADQADWKKNGVGGIVGSVEGNGTIVVESGTRKVSVTTSPQTQYRRFARDSVEYKDSTPGTLAQIRQGDQIQVRGTKSEDGSSVQAAEVVSGSFKNLSGLVASIDPSGHKLTLKDLATKKTFTVDVTPNSNLRKMSPQMANMVARSNGKGGGGQGAAGGPGGGNAAGGGGQRGGGGGDLSTMISRLPTVNIADLKQGDAVMIVASEPTPGSTSVTALTLLSGVEPILTANPNGGVDLSGWSMGGGAPTE